MIKPMLPTLAFDIPKGDEWRYEIKFDGFRAVLSWDSEIALTSRNGKPLLSIFPEIRDFLLSYREHFKPFLPLEMDAELVFFGKRIQSKLWSDTSKRKNEVKGEN